MPRPVIDFRRLLIPAHQRHIPQVSDESSEGGEAVEAGASNSEDGEDAAEAPKGDKAVGSLDQSFRSAELLVNQFVIYFIQPNIVN